MEYLMTFENYHFGKEEFVEIKNPETGKSVVLRAKIDTEAYTTNIDYNIALDLGLIANGEKRVYNILGDRDLKTSNVTLVFNTGEMKGRSLETEVTIADRSKLRNQMAVGRSDLKNLDILIDIRKEI